MANKILLIIFAMILAAVIWATAFFVMTNGREATGHFGLDVGIPAALAVQVVCVVGMATCFAFQCYYLMRR